MAHHRDTHPEYVEGCYHCKILSTNRAQSYSNGVTNRDTPPSGNKNSFERGNRTDERGISYLDKDGAPLKMKERFDSRDYGQGPIRIGY